MKSVVMFPSWNSGRFSSSYRKLRSSYSFDCDFPKGADHFPDGTVTVFVIDDDLGDHGIIVWRDCVVIVDCRVHADSISAGQMQVCDPARAWHGMSLRVFCVDPALRWRGRGFLYLSAERLVVHLLRCGSAL